MEVQILNSNTDVYYFEMWSDLYSEMINNQSNHGIGLRKELESINTECMINNLITPDFYFLAVDGDQALGYGMIQLKTISLSIPDECYAHIYVSEKQRGCGIGSRILDKMLKSMNNSRILFQITDIILSDEELDYTPN